MTPPLPPTDIIFWGRRGCISCSVFEILPALLTRIFSLCFSILTQTILSQGLDLLEDAGAERVGLTYSTTVAGEQFVTITGIWMMREWFVVRLVILPQGMLSKVRTSEREVERFRWIMSTAWAMSPLLRDVHTLDGKYITVITMKMHLSFVYVSMTL